MFHLPRAGVHTQLRCEGEGWQTELLDMGGGHAMVLVTAGPRGTSATVTVDVTRDRDGRTVPVDLTFSAR